MKRLVALVALMTLVPFAAAQAAPPPRTFVGLVSNDAFAQTGLGRQQTLAAQYAAGVGLLRQTFDWTQIERTPGQLDFSTTDGFVLDAARAGITVMPVLFGAPAWWSTRPPGVTSPYTYPPRDPEAFAAFAAAVVHRYGTHGTLWAAHPEVVPQPMRDFQIWNEPNLPKYWMPRPSAAAYAQLLRAAGGAIHRAQRGAEVLTGGMPDSRSGIPLLRYLGGLYAHRAANGFDIVAVNAYSATVAAFMRRLQRVRAVQRRHHDDAGRMWVTEFGWSDSGPRSHFRVGARRQAALLQGTVTAMARQRQSLHLDGFVYYEWRDAPPYSGTPDFWGLHTGLHAIDGTPKPAARALAAAVRTLR